MTCRKYDFSIEMLLFMHGRRHAEVKNKNRKHLGKKQEEYPYFITSFYLEMKKGKTK